MAAKLTNNIFFFTNALKVLKYLAENPEKEHLGGEVQDAVKISRAGVYFALRDLEKQGLILKQKKGRGKLLIYKLRNSNPIVRQYKVLNNILSIENLVEMLKPVSRKVILYGSTARGDDTSESDIDIFVVSKDTGAARKIIDSYGTGLYRYLHKIRNIQAVIKTQVEYSNLKEKDKVFCKEVDRGIILWGEENEHSV